MKKQKIIIFFVLSIGLLFYGSPVAQGIVSVTLSASPTEYKNIGDIVIFLATATNTLEEADKCPPTTKSDYRVQYVLTIDGREADRKLASAGGSGQIGYQATTRFTTTASAHSAVASFYCGASGNQNGAQWVSSSVSVTIKQSTPTPDGGGGSPGSSSGCPPGQDTDNHQSFSSTNPCKLINPAPGQLVGTSDFGQLLKDIIQILLMFAGAIAVIFLIIGGFRYVMSAGNEEGMEKAKKTITSAVIGIVIIIMAFAIVTIINTLLTRSPDKQYTPTGNTGIGTSSPNSSNLVTITSIPSAQRFVRGDRVSLILKSSPDGNYTWSKSGALPKGVSWNASSYIITGTVAADATYGEYKYTITATGGGKRGSQEFTMRVVEPGSGL